jgi:hypothetical protein
MYENIMETSVTTRRVADSQVVGPLFLKAKEVPELHDYPA